MSTVIVIDDDPSVLRAMQRLLGSMDYEVETFASAESFLDAFAAVDPDCILLDIEMPGLNGMKLQEILSEAAHEPPIVFMTGHGDIPMSVRAMKKGAVDFLQKPVDEEDLLSAVEAAVARHRETRRLWQQRKRVADRLGSLTPRESEVLGHVIEGKLNKLIAAELEISEKTVKVHRGRIMEKLGVRSVAALVRLAARAGIGAE